MTKIDKIKILAMEKVVLAEDYNKDEKLEMLNYIREGASVKECVDFINEQGKATKYRTTAHSVVGTGVVGAATTAGVYSALKNHPLTKNKLANIAKSGGAKLPHAGLVFAKGAAIGLAQWAGYRLVRSLFDKCTKQCGLFKINTPKRQLCLYKCKEQMLIKTISGANGHVSPTKIAELKVKLAKVREKIASMSQYE